MVTQSITDQFSHADSFQYRLNYSFVTIGQYISAVGDPGIDKHPFVRTLISTTNSTFVKFLNRGNYWWNKYTEYYSGDGNTNTLILKHFPNITILELNEDNDDNADFGSDTTMVEDTDFRLEKDQGMIKRFGNFTKGIRNIKVIYFGGVQDAPEELKFAAVEYCHFLSTRIRRSGISSESKQGTQFVYRDEAIPETVKSALRKYRSPATNRLGWMEP